MSSQYGKILDLILLERFGPVVEKVGSFLYKFGPSPLLFIKRGTDLPLAKVKEALCILIKFRLVSFQPNKNEVIANYKLEPDKIMLMIRYPKYIHLIKKKFGDISEFLIENLLQKGYCSISEIILSASAHFKKDNNPVTLVEIRDKLFALINAKYIGKVPYSVEEKAVPTLELNETEEFALPEINLKLLSLIEKGEKLNSEDKNKYWCVSFDRFHQDLRDEIIVNAFTKKFDENTGDFVRVLIELMYIRTEPWAESSNPVPLYEIKEHFKKRDPNSQLIMFFDQYANVLEQDSNSLIRKAGDAGGGSVQIFVKDTFVQLTWELIEQLVLEKFDTKAARIFRLVKLKKYIEADQIQQLAMIPAKEAKRLTYQLLEENFLKLQELKKTAPSAGPTKTFMLFYIKLNHVVRMALELCYKTLFNLMTRRNHERFVNKRIIDKKDRVETIALSMRVQGADEEQLADIEEMITPPEREILEKIDKTMKKLSGLELEIDDTIFLLQLYLIYENK